MLMADPQAFPPSDGRSGQYLVSGVKVAADDPTMQACLARAHRLQGAGERPRCLCTAAGAEMYVSRIGGVFYLKRMPGQGAAHAWNCTSYEPPAELSGLGQLLGAAIQEDPADGTTALKLGFPMTKLHRKVPAASEAAEEDSAIATGARLSLRGLLHYLWEEAGFCRWSPAMAGKRSWPVLRRFLIAALARKRCRGAPLSEVVYVPEPWDEGRKDEIAARRRALFLKIASGRRDGRKLMLLLGEVRLIEPARYGHRLVVKHAPDVDFALDEALVAALRRRFETELSTWDAQHSARDRAGHLVVFGTFSVGLSGRPAMEELVLMSTNRNWIPIEDAFDAEVIERLTVSGHRFSRCLRYNLSAGRPLACALVPDTEAMPTALYVVRPGASETYERLLEALIGDSGLRSWIWRAPDGPMPALPRRGPAAPGPGLPPSIDLGRPSSGFDAFAGLGPAGTDP